MVHYVNISAINWLQTLVPKCSVNSGIEYDLGPQFYGLRYPVLLCTGTTYISKLVPSIYFIVHFNTEAITLHYIFVDCFVSVSVVSFEKICRINAVSDERRTLGL